MKLKCIEYEVGQDDYGRSVTLRLEKGGSGNLCWTINIMAASQRDDEQIMRGLPGEVILAMAEAVKECKGR